MTEPIDSTSPATAEAPEAPLMVRSSTVGDVNFSQRIIEVVAAPYDEVTKVPWRGEIWDECFLRGAWDGIEKRPNRVRANRDHDTTRTVGKVVRFWPSRQEGLVAEVRIAQTPLGDETLALANEDCLGASVGYRARPADTEINKMSRLRRIRKAFIDHLAFAPDQMYPGAGVLSVRSGEMVDPEPLILTPRLDELTQWLQSRSR